MTSREDITHNYERMENTGKNKKINKEPSVTIFGHILDEEAGMTKSQRKSRFDAENLTWGILFIFAGIIFLLNTIGILPWNVWGTIGHFWPILIILIGVDMVFGKSLVAKIVGLNLKILALLIILGVALTVVAPKTISWLPVEITNFFGSVVSNMQLK